VTRIIQETPTTLVFKNNYILRLIIAFAFIIIGIALLVFPIESLKAQNPYFNLILAGAFLLGGVFNFFLTPLFTTKTFDKGVNKVTFHSKRLLWSNDKSYVLSDISRVDLRERQVKNVVYQLFLIFKDGNEVAFDTLKARKTILVNGNPVSLGGDSKERVTGQKIANFLGVPLNESKPPGIGAAISQVAEAFKKEKTTDSP